MREDASLELKAEFTRSFLKTVSAFANYGDGEILFGIDDSGKLIGVDDPRDLSSRIENSINDSLEPLPTYSLDTETLNGKSIVKLRVFQGVDTPYCAAGKAYKRSHASTVKVDASELRRLVLKGLNISFEECPAKDQDLTFESLNGALGRRLGIEDADEKVYRTLKLYTTAHGFNNAAAVLADENGFPGIDIVRFGKSIDELMERSTLEHVSALALFDEAMTMFDRYYERETIKGSTREGEYLIPVTAFREAIANALVHRDWNVKGMVRVSLFDDRIEIGSPGGLPDGVAEEDYLAGRLSVLRNPIIADVFARLGYIEKFGTGIPRIKAAYEGTGLAPRFSVSATSIVVVLPSVSSIDDLDDDGRFVMGLLGEHGPLKRSDIEKRLGVSKSTATRILKRLESENLIESEGVGRATKYKL